MCRYNLLSRNVKKDKTLNRNGHSVIESHKVSQKQSPRIINHNYISTFILIVTYIGFCPVKMANPSNM